MAIKGIEGMTTGQLHLELQQGAKFVVYQYCISIVILTFRRSSEIHYIKPGESAVGKGLPYILLSFLAGWWGIPWGPIWTIGSLANNFRGGKDVTSQVAPALLRQ